MGRSVASYPGALPQAVSGRAFGAIWIEAAGELSDTARCYAVTASVSPQRLRGFVWSSIKGYSGRVGHGGPPLRGSTQALLPIRPTTIITMPMPQTTPETIPTVCISATGSVDFEAIDRM
jgi:hypothetical protein